MLENLNNFDPPRRFCVTELTQDIPSKLGKVSNFSASTFFRKDGKSNSILTCCFKARFDYLPSY